MRVTSAYDLIIVGGGPAGTSAAITAAAAGLNTLLLERGSFPRQKVCGEFVSAESLDLLGNLLNSEHKPLLRQATRILQARVFLDGHTIETVIDPPAASIARLDLDAAMWASAQHYGVEARERITVQNISGNGPFRVTTSAGDFDSRAVINASGRWSNLTATASRIGRPAEKWLGLKGHFSESQAHPSVDLYFFAGGYCGVQPVNLRHNGAGENRVNVCAMVDAEVASTIDDVFSQHPQLKERSRDWTRLGDPVSTSPLFFRTPQPVLDGILRAGDAAAFVDPFVGDGISLALRSGAMAAESLLPFLREEVSLEDAGRTYRRVYRQRLAPVFKTSSLIRRVIELPRVIRRPMIFVVRATPGLSKYLVKRTR